jgi:hypothetical protein
MEVKKTQAVANVEKHGMTGANALWDGPLSLDGFPKGKGSSSGKNGMEVSKVSCSYKSAPITQRAKCKM